MIDNYPNGFRTRNSSINRTVSITNAIAENGTAPLNCGMCRDSIWPGEQFLIVTHEDCHSGNNDLKAQNYGEDLHVRCLPSRIQWMLDRSIVRQEST